MIPTISPGYSHTLEEAAPEEGHTTGGVKIKQLEHVHTTLKKMAITAPQFKTHHIEIMIYRY